MSKLHRGKNVPDEDHVVRHVPWARLRRDEDGNVLGFLPQAFKLREGEDGLSVNWAEYYQSDYKTNIEATIRGVRAVMDVKPKSAFGVSTVQAIKGACQTSSRTVKVVYWPTSADNQSHALIRNLPEDDLVIMEALASDAFAELILNSSIPP